MPRGEDKLNEIVGDMSWLEGVKLEFQQGRTAAEIAADAGVGTRTAERWRVACGLAPKGGRQSRGAGKGPKNQDFKRRMQLQGAADKFKRPTAIKWSAKVKYEKDGRKQGSRGQRNYSPYNGMDAVSAALRRGDMRAAGQALEDGIKKQYMPRGEGDGLHFDFEELDIDW